MSTAAFHLIQPVHLRTGVVFASPHSGSTYTAEFLRASRLDEHAIRSSEDAFVDRLFASAPEFGAPLLSAAMPRAYVDLNRASDELDPDLIEGVRRFWHNPRVASGLGVIPRVVANGRAIYSRKISLKEAGARIERHWHPYHAQLQALLTAAHVRFGQAILIDCHSMPHEAMDGTSRPDQRRPQIVLGDRFGASADGGIVDRIEAAFVRAGLAVTRNAPFAGAYVAQTYGNPQLRQHVVQIEIDRALYMDERSIRPNADFDGFCNLLRGVIRDITRIGREEMPLVAE